MSAQVRKVGAAVRWAVMRSASTAARPLHVSPAGAGGGGGGRRAGRGGRGRPPGGAEKCFLLPPFPWGGRGVGRRGGGRPRRWIRFGGSFVPLDHGDVAKQLRQEVAAAFVAERA